ncbi:hypothetical protein A6R68_23965 [Neotoma lepida]|uniref:Uncharacterized protein n=1 Tax=Neotoma lepida TaxID=56216 RepID=A0A1A6HVK9_NEOLE|nr:hypothetical protein A6R68_23965 [Neotoma lepida]
MGLWSSSHRSCQRRGPLDNSKLEAIAQEINAELVENSCLGFCFKGHRAVKCGYFFLDDMDPDSMKDFEIMDQPSPALLGQPEFPAAAYHPFSLTSLGSFQCSCL